MAHSKIKRQAHQQLWENLTSIICVWANSMLIEFHWNEGISSSMLFHFVIVACDDLFSVFKKKSTKCDVHILHWKLNCYNFIHVRYFCLPIPRLSHSGPHPVRPVRIHFNYFVGWWFSASKCKIVFAKKTIAKPRNFNKLKMRKFSKPLTVFTTQENPGNPTREATSNSSSSNEQETTSNKLYFEANKNEKRTSGRISW